MSKIKEYFYKRTSEQIFSLCLLIGIVVLMLFCCIVRLCGGLWFTADLSNIKTPSVIWIDAIHGVLLVFELTFVYKMLCRKNWLVCIGIALVQTGINLIIGYTVKDETTSQIIINMLNLVCYFIIPLPFVKHWFSLIDSAVLYGLELLYSLMFMVGRIGNISTANGYNFMYSIIGTIDYKLFIVALFLTINYFGGIRLWKTQKRLILQKELKKNN